MNVEEAARSRGAQPVTTVSISNDGRRSIADDVEILEHGRFFWITDNDARPNMTGWSFEEVKIKDDTLELGSDQYDSKICIDFRDMLWIEWRERSPITPIVRGPSICITYTHDLEGMLLNVYLLPSDGEELGRLLLAVIMRKFTTPLVNSFGRQVSVWAV